jgi:transposase
VVAETMQPGLLLSIVVHPAHIQDRDGMRDVLRDARRSFPFIERIFADAGYQGPKAAKTVADTGRWVIEIVKRSDAHNFVVLPERWIVERTLAWISRNRRLACDFEALRPIRRGFRASRHDPHHTSPLG